MRKIIAIFIKELSQIRRDRRSLLLIFVMPVLQLLILGFASNLDVRELALAVFDQDKSRLSRELINNFNATEYFSLAAELTALDQLDPLIKSGQIKIALIIQPGFERDSYRSLMNQEFEPTVQLIFDGSESYTANIGIQYASLVVANFNHKLGLRLYRISSSTLAPAGRLEPRSRVWFNPELNSRHFLIPGIMAMLLMLVTILLTALAIVREKELGTLEQLLVTPLRPHELILGKLLPFFFYRASRAIHPDPGELAGLWDKPERQFAYLLLPFSLFYSANPRDWVFSFNLFSQSTAGHACGYLFFHPPDDPFERLCLSYKQYA